MVFSARNLYTCRHFTSSRTEAEEDLDHTWREASFLSELRGVESPERSQLRNNDTDLNVLADEAKRFYLDGVGAKMNSQML